METENEFFSLENGFIKFVSLPKPVFEVYNLKMDRPIFLYPREMRTLVKDLPELMRVAALAQKELDETEGNETDGAVKDGEPQPEGRNVFEKVLLKVNSSVVKMTVDVYKGKSYVWLKRFFVPKEDTEGLYPNTKGLDLLACKGGTMLSENDDCADMNKFIQTCLLSKFKKTVAVE